MRLQVRTMPTAPYAADHPLELTLSGFHSFDPAKGSAAPMLAGQSSQALQIGMRAPSDPLGLRSLGILGAASKDMERPPGAGDPALFPKAMLDAMTPEQRAQVLGTLAKQRAGGTPTLSTQPQALDPTLFPQSMLDAMTPEQRAQVLGTLGKQRAGGTKAVSAQPQALDPTLFPQSMLDAMTPEQRAQVLGTLAKQRTGGTGR